MNISVIENTPPHPQFAKWDVYHKFMFHNCFLQFWLWKLLAWSKIARADNHLSSCQHQMDALQVVQGKNIPWQY